MHNSFFTNVLLLLSLICTAVVASPENSGVLAIRQNPQCVSYGRTANLSTIGANSTFRAAFLQASPLGSLAAAKPLDEAILQNPSLAMNAALNQECGNLTAVAATEAAKNFTMGIVAQFANIQPAPALTNGPVIIVVCVVIILGLAGMYASL